LLAAKHWVVPVREWARNDDWQSEDGKLKASHDENGLVRPQYVEAMLAAGLYDEKDGLKDGLLDPDCIEARAWNLSAGQYKPFDFTQLKSDKSVTELIGELRTTEQQIIDGLGKTAGDGGGAGMTRFVLPPLDDSWQALTLGKLAAIKYGSALTATSRASDGAVPVYGSSGQVGTHNTPLHTERSIVIGRKGSVGSIFLTNGPFWCIDTAYYLAELSEVVSLDFLAAYLQSLDLSRLAISVAIPGLNRQELAGVPVPLPSLLEQKRIVDVLWETACLSKGRTDTDATIATLTREYYAKLFGDVFRNDKAWSTKKIDQISDVVRGSSPRPQGDPRLFGGPVPRLMVSDLTRDGLWVDATTDSLTIEGAKSSRLMPAQSVVMAVSGAPGLTAIMNHEACIHDGFVGFRNLRTDLLPEFLAFTLNLLRIKNDQQAVGAVFRNLTTDQVKAISIPVPPLDLQQQFQSFMFQVKSVQRDISRATKLLQKLASVVSVDAFSGQLTANWREQHHAEIVASAQERDTLLRERGAKPTSRPPEPAPLAALSTVAQLPNRQWLLDELSEFQRLVLDAFLDIYAHPAQPLLAEDPDVFASFCDNEALDEKLAAFPPTSPNHIRRTLSQLAALGLIAKITLPKTNPITGEREYLTAFRPLRDGDRSRAADLALLRKMLRGTTSQETYTFDVGLDYETSEHAGAGGMFQVASVTDAEGRSRVDLVDQGKHYARLEEVAADIARALGVAADQIMLEEV
jgi:type I restriction enzyme, S subunit